MENILKTGYDWCFECSIRIINLEDWETSLSSKDESYYKEKISLVEFYKRLDACVVKSKSMPRKTEMFLEYRMYGLVPYNISPIQQGIQFGHAVVDYGRMVEGFDKYNAIYKKFADEDKTFIILNGGTTNNNESKLGSINIHMKTMEEAGVLLQTFYEPDLGDQLTAIAFLVDERVFNKELYPDFIAETIPWSKKKPSETAISQLDAKNNKNYLAWEEKIGGGKNAFLRTYLKNLRLA